MGMPPVCYVCFIAEYDHECKVAKKLIENPTELEAPYIAPQARPTRENT